ncbi:MAG: DUF3800 domain-containing protein [Planctomycetia bacterium]|nr:DUF3800 domain-containing protein [Planctomycetia bacterium]
MNPRKVTYVLLDEGGNLDFSPNGSKYFTLTSLVCSRPFLFDEPLAACRMNLVERGLNIEYFHATEDTQATRNEVFAVLKTCLNGLVVDSVIVEKRKTGPSLRDEFRFYPEMVGHLLQYAFRNPRLAETEEFIIITDKLPKTKKSNAIEKGLKMHLHGRLPPGAKFRIYHHQAKAWAGLQAADYFNWAIYRWWTNSDNRSLDIVRPAIRSQFDIFQRGSKIWY